MPLATVEQAIEAFQQGRMVIIVDDEDRENEGDLAMAAQFVTPEAINFMASYGRGLICAPMSGERLEALGVPMMVPPKANTSGFGTPFTVSVEAVEGVSTGISAADRARTIQVLANPASQPTDIAMPGHIFPLRANPNGVLARRGQTEASFDLARLGGLLPAAVICEVMNEDGTMARMPQLETFADEHDMLIVSVEAIARYRMRTEPMVTFSAETRLPTEFGEFNIAVYTDNLNGKEHIALWTKDMADPPLVRVHSECATGDIFGSQRCDCGEQLDFSLAEIGRNGGMLLYLRQEGRGIGLIEKLKAYALQDQGMDTVEANLALGHGDDEREYYAAAHILQHREIGTIRLMTNNPSKIEHITDFGINVVERVPVIIDPNPNNRDYIDTKRTRMGHLLPYLNGVVH